VAAPSGPSGGLSPLFPQAGAIGQHPVSLPPVMGSLIKKRRKRMRKKKHRKMLKRTRAQRMRGK